MKEGWEEEIKLVQLWYSCMYMGWAIIKTRDSSIWLTAKQKEEF